MNELSILHQKIDRLTAELQNIKQLLARQGFAHTGDKPLNVTEAADFTGLSLSTIYKLVHYNKLQPIQRKKRGRLLFEKQTLIDFINS